MSASNLTFRCPFCNVVKVELPKFLYHLKLLHEHSANFSVSCHVCGKLFHVVESLRKLFKRKHCLAAIGGAPDVPDNNDDGMEVDPDIVRRNAWLCDDENSAKYDFISICWEI